jgi:hypothetical protein
MIRGGVRQQVYFDSNLSSDLGILGLLNAENFPKSPDSDNYVAVFEQARGVRGRYGQRVSGYMCPPLTGAYRLCMGSDDQSKWHIRKAASPMWELVSRTCMEFTNL